jgi:GH35 family endo-1,4-beta-xylanase
MPTLKFDLSLPPGIELRSAYLTDLERRPLKTEVRRVGWLELETSARPPYIVRAVIGSSYGDLDVAIDNDCAGYAPSISAPNLLIEAIASRIWRCERRLDDANLSESDFPALAEAQEHFARGDFANAFLAAMRVGDDIEYQASLKALQANGRTTLFSGSICFGERLGRWSIGVGPDWPEGMPPPDFARPFNGREALLPVCEAMTLPNFWRWIEPERGKPRWGVLEDMVGWARGNNLLIKSFAIFWLGIGSCPPWLRDLPYREQLDEIERWTRALVERFKGHVAAWETVNENHDWSFGNPFGWSRHQRVEVSRLVNELVGSLDPGTPRVVNSCCIWGDYATSDSPRTSWLPAALPPASDSPLHFLEHLIEHDVPFEGVGLQYYLPGRDLLECADTLDRYLALGKQAWVTEMGTPGLPQKNAQVETQQITPGSGWRGPWSEALQADWTRMWYTIASARPGVRALNYWDLDDARAFIDGAGLINQEGWAKPAFNAIVSLRNTFPLR